MEANFQRSLKYLLIDEGGNDDDPDDHGGRTSRGITQREYNAWRRENNLPPSDVWDASDDEVKSIYHDEYWFPYCGFMPTAIDYLYFDMAVNAGPYRAAVLLQRALGVTDDGRIGPITRRAIRSAEPRQLISNYSDSKERFYRSLHQPKYIRGWLNRVKHVQDNAISMLESQVEEPQV